MNKHNCMAVAFATAMYLSLDVLIERLGHDGSAKVFDAPEPYCYRSWHIQEIINACWSLGFSVTHFEVNPVLGCRFDPKVISIEYDLTAIIDSTVGVACGIKSNGKPHAMCCKRGTTDPVLTNLLYNLPAELITDLQLSDYYVVEQRI